MTELAVPEQERLLLPSPQLGSIRRRSSQTSAASIARRNRHLRTGIARDLAKFMRSRRKLNRTLEEAQATQREIGDLQDVSAKLEYLVNELNKNAAFVIFGQTFNVKVRIAEMLLGEKFFFSEQVFDNNATQRTIKVVYGKKNSYTISVDGDNNEDFDFVEEVHQPVPGYDTSESVEVSQGPQIEIKASNKDLLAQCSRSLEVKMNNELLRESTSVILTTTNNKHFSTKQVFLQATNENFPIVIYGLESPQLTEKDKDEIKELRESSPTELQFLFLNMGIARDSEFTESAQDILWQVMENDLRDVGVVESLPKQLEKVINSTSALLVSGQDISHPSTPPGLEDDDGAGDAEDDNTSRHSLNPNDEFESETRTKKHSINRRTMSIVQASGNEVSVVTNSRLASSTNFLDQLDLFVREILKLRTIQKSDEARILLTEYLEDCISTTYQFTKDAKLIPVRIKWAKEQEEKLYHALLSVSNEKQFEIRGLIKKSIEESREVLIDSAERHEFSQHSSSNSLNKSVRNERRELEEMLIRKLNGVIADNLVDSVQMLKATMIETLRRTVESLEENSPGLESSLESSQSTLVTGFSAKNALNEILSAAYHIEINSRNTLSLRAILFEKLKLIFNTLSSPEEINDDWKRRVAIQILEKISEDKLAKEVCWQFRSNVERAHNEFLSSIDSIQESQIQKMDVQAEKSKKLKKSYSPRLARFVLESTCYRDYALYGMPRYEQEIGRGQYGVVYCSKRWGPFGPCAIKSVAPPDEKHWNSLAMEFYYTKSLPENPRIVQIRGCVIDSTYGNGTGAVLLIMDKMKRDLHTAIRQGMPLVPRLQVAIDVVEGLRYLHSRDLVHRDIKLKNVLLDEMDRGKITDLGFSKPQAMMCGSVVGTPIHMAPELFKGSYDSSVDVYAFGILFWYICAGTVRLPQNFEQCSSKENLWSSVQKGCRPEKLCAVFSNEMWQLMTDCWSSNPINRLTLGAIQDQLFKIKHRESTARASQEHTVSNTD